VVRAVHLLGVDFMARRWVREMGYINGVEVEAR
jgi:hypothetical protein